LFAGGGTVGGCVGVGIGAGGGVGFVDVDGDDGCGSDRVGADGADVAQPFVRA
jgi:hypothetical protein